ncbi:MAG: hypothetical protein IJI37_06265 [Opitutales bacterium]|nr:hypothetical protein [Opitutales bacterium]
MMTAGANSLDFFGGKNPLDFGVDVRNAGGNPLDFFGGKDPFDFRGKRKVYGGTNYENGELRVNDYSAAPARVHRCSPYDPYFYQSAYAQGGGE